MGGSEPEPSKVLLFDGEVEAYDVNGLQYAVGEFTPSSALPETDLEVELNGQKYTLPYGFHEDNGSYWGGLDSEGMPSLENYPLFVNENLSYSENFDLVVTEAGTYSLKIWGEEDESPTIPIDDSPSMGNIS